MTIEPATVEEINEISIHALLNKEPIIHTVECDELQEVEMHTHCRATIGELDMKSIFPKGYQSVNLDPNVFEVIINEEDAECRKLTMPNTFENLFKEDILEDDEYVKYTVFIIREDCEVEEINGQMLPYRFVRVFWSFEPDLTLDEQSSKYKDATFYTEDHPEVLEYIKKNGDLLTEFVTKLLKDVKAEIDSKYLDSIGLDFDLPALEKITDEDTLRTLAADFLAVSEQLPNNPFFLHRPPHDLPKGLMHVYGLCYNENIDLYNTGCSVGKLDKECLEFVRDKMKCRIAVFNPDDIDVEVLSTMDLEEVRVHRSILFIPLSMFNMETLSHLNDDVNRRLEELIELFSKYED